MKNILLMILLVCASYARAQTASGRVFELVKQNNKTVESAIPGTIVYWQDESHKVFTDTNGYFQINAPDSLPANLIFKFVGFAEDTLLVHRLPLKNIEVALRTSGELGTFVLEEETNASWISISSPWNKEVLSADQFKTAACCNVSEVFESNASVDVNFSDAVSGAKSIQFLGLDGVYAQIMLENVPFIRGLESRYGLTTIPGTWLNSIQVTKGTGSVINGYESFTGQLNIEYLKPDQEALDKWFVNLYGNNNGRMEGNFHYVQKINDKVSTMLLGHGMYLNTTNDHNSDGFYDAPLTRQYGLTNRWRYMTDKVEGHIVGGFMHVNNIGGQTSFDPNTDKLTTNNYGVGVNARQYYAYIKNGFLFPEQKFTSLGLIGHVKRYEQDAYFGLNEYQGVQNHAYFNAIFTDIIGNSLHTINTGISGVYDNMSEGYNDSTWSREELVPGVFAEYNYKDGLRTSFVAGLRGDYNMYFDKMWITPRIHWKYFITEHLAIRLGGGRSFRTPNTISENLMLLASARDIKVMENIRYEEAWNYGGSLTYDYEINKKEGTWRLDGYQTRFVNQLIVDRDASAQEIRFYNLDGTSFSTVIQTDINQTLTKNVSVNLAYKWSNVKATIDGKFRQVPLVPEHRVLFNIGLNDKKEIWQFDMTVNWFGPRRLPITSGNPEDFQLPEFSEDYWMINAQITKTFKRFEIYVGAENLLNFKQNNAIIASDDPFGTYFDASNIWGPVNGRMFHFGFRTKFL